MVLAPPSNNNFNNIIDLKKIFFYSDESSVKEHSNLFDMLENELCYHRVWEAECVSNIKCLI